MKLLTIAIPCYNSAEYMTHAVESALIGGDDVEIILIDDGSTDTTGMIAESLSEKYPSIVRSIHQPNGGHGAAVNTGLSNATGLYFKVLDSDDWLDKGALSDVLTKMRDDMDEGRNVDLYISNYVYEKPDAHKHRVIKYDNALPEDKVFGWGEVGRFKTSQNLLMHSIIYRTRLLRSCGLKLPKHTFYVDNIYAYTPLPYVKTIRYINVDLYRYYIGREDQSVNEKVMIGRIDQQLKINKIMIDAHDLGRIRSKGLRNYMAKYLAMMMMVSSVFLIKEGSLESQMKKDELWDYLKARSRRMYRMVNHRAFSRQMQTKTSAGRKIVVWGYLLAQKFYGFN